VHAARVASQPVQKTTVSHWLRPHDGDVPRMRAICEAIVPTAILLLQVSLVPLGSGWFPVVATVLSGLVIAYAIVGLTRFQDSSRRWQLTPPWWYDGKDYAYGVVFVFTLLLAGIGPIFAIRYFEAPLPNPGSPWRYLAWCLIQDFIFFSLILRGLVDLTHPLLAICFTAVLFGLSHYPNYEMVFGTILVAAAWAYLFLASRWLLFVLISHWLMGLLLLTR
jgi:membrane protease YdiL (CAAX protease family)